MSDFNISEQTAVVTSTYVTEDKCHILEVSHEEDDDGSSIWQFHSGNSEFPMEKMQLVRLDTILKIDPSVSEVSNLKVGQIARRQSIEAPWIIL